MPLSSSSIDSLRSAIQSLKLYRRAELADEQGRSRIKELYVDPLPEEQVFKTLLKANSTYLIGRKGTGKSTIFQRIQEELKSTPNSTWAYIDIKSVYESAVVDSHQLEVDPTIASALGDAALQRLLIHKTFLLAVIAELRTQLNTRLRESVLERIKEAFTGRLGEAIAGMNELVAQIESDQFINITQAQVLKRRSEQAASSETKSAETGSLTASSEGPKIGYEATSAQSDTSGMKRREDETQILLRVFNASQIQARICDVLREAGLRHMYLFIDDFSELPEPAMRVVTDLLLAPLNNWSNEFIKLKVAAYPHRIYFGDIDRTKIDEVFLDLYKAFGGAAVSAMEERAASFIRRLVESRIREICKDKIDDYFETVTEELWEVLFHASMGNPRVLGYVLYFAFEAHVIFGRKIGLRAIREAARRYYEDKVESYFGVAKFLHESFSERSSIYSLKELLEEIVSKARDLKNYKDSAIIRDIEGQHPTSHFHIPTSYDAILATLELNFFITKYYELKDRGAREVSVYAINYGLCQKHAVEFGRPKGKREYRLYLLERIFDYTIIFAEYVRKHQEIVCDNCNAKYGIDMLDALRLYNMECPKCKAGFCTVVNLSRKYEGIIRGVAQDLLLPETELGILQTLNAPDRKMYARDIAEELDCSYQLVGRRAKKLAELDLVDRPENTQGRREFSLKEKAKSVYFKDQSTAELELNRQPEPFTLPTGSDY